MKTKAFVSAALSLSLAVMTVCGCGQTKEKAGSNKSVSILTPYLSAAATKQMCESLEKGLKANGISVNVSDTHNDFATLSGKIEDAVTDDTGAIILVSVDPSQVSTSLKEAFDSDIPVFGCDSGYIDGMQVNATSDNYKMGKEMCDYLFDDKMQGKGTVVALTYRPHPGIIKRCQAFDDELKIHPDIKLIKEQQVDVPAGPIESSQKIMEELLREYPDKGSITAVWCAWDEAAIGAEKALEAAGRDEVIVTGVDGNSQALGLIDKGTDLKATMSQNFDKMAEMIVDDVTDLLNGKEIQKGEKYAPASLIKKD